MARVSFEKIGRSFAFGALAEFWRIGSRFIVTPIVIGAVGLAGYGVWTLLFSIAAYIAITNVGFGVAYNKFTAECVRSGEYDRLRGIIGAGIVAVGSVAVVALALAWLLGEPLLRAVNVPPDMIGDAHIAMLLVMTVVVGRLTLGCSYEVLAGLQRIDLVHRLSILASFVEFAVTVPLLLMDYGLVGMAIGYTVGQALCFALGLRWVRREDPRIAISPLHVTRAGMRDVLTLGGRMQAISFVHVGVTEGVKVLLAVLIDPRATALYELADKLAQLIQAPTTAIAAPLLAAFADLRAGGEKARERELLEHGWKAVAIVSFASALFIAATAAPALLAWTGRDVPEAAWALQCVALGGLLTHLTAVQSMNLRAQGNVRLEFWFAIVSTVTGVGALLATVAFAPFEAVVIARVVGAVVGGAWYIRAFLRHADITVAQWWRGAALGRVVMVVGAAGAMVAAGRTVLPMPAVGSPRITALVELGLWGTLYAVVLGISVWKLVLDPGDRERLGGMIGGRLRRFRGG